MNKSAQRYIVVGGGISGLAAGFRLQQDGAVVTVLETDETVGGRMSSVEHDGFTFNRAANILPGSYAAIRSLADDAGVGEQLGTMEGIIATMRDGEAHRLRSDKLVTDGAKTKLIGWKAKLRAVPIAIDALRMRSSLSYENLGAAARFDTETVAEYCERRLTPELAEYIVEPVVRALFTAEAERVSVVDFFFAALNFIGSGFMTYPGGIDFLANTLSEQLDVQTRSTVSSVEQEGNQVRVRWTSPSGDHEETVDGCVLAVVGSAVPGLHPGLDARQAEILRDEFDYGITYNAQFALRKKPDEPSVLIQVPRAVDPGLCVVTFDHNSSPSVAPPGRGKVASYWHHLWCEPRQEHTDDELLAEMYPSLEKVVPGLPDLVEFARIDRWSPSVLRSRPGTYARIAEFTERIDPSSPIQLAGDYLTASSTNGCAISGKLAAERLLTQESRRRSR